MVRSARRRPATGALPAVAMLVLAALTAGCGGGTDDGMLSPAQARFEPELTVLDATGTERTVFAPGEPITFRLRVANAGSGKQTLTTPSAQQYDFAVRDVAAGGEVWRWSTGRGFASVVTSIQFGPGETREFVETWNQADDAGKPVAPGRYQADARLVPDEDGLIAAPVLFEIR